MSRAKGQPRQRGPQAEPVAALDTGGLNIEVAPSLDGIDNTAAVDAPTLAEGLANVGDTAAIQYRLDQQAVLADFGLEALRQRPWPDLLQLATEMCAKGMKARLAKALRYESADEMLLVMAGTGWNPGVVGVTRIAADMGSPAGYALKSGKPVISNHVHGETRFRTPPMLAEHGVQRAINVLIVAHGAPWGVLEVDSVEGGRFEVADIAFLQGFANLLGVAFERHDAEARLQAALDHQRLLVGESSHRTKNSLALLSSLLNLQSRASPSEAVRAALGEANARIATLASAHDLLWRSTAVGMIDAGRFIGDLCERMQPQAPTIAVHHRADSFDLPADQAIALGLLVTELVTNAFKHAFPSGAGHVEVGCVGTAAHFVVRVADDGAGLPADFDLEAPHARSLGMRMVRSLVQQLGGVMTIERRPGTAFVLAVERAG